MGGDACCGRGLARRSGSGPRPGRLRFPGRPARRTTRPREPATAGPGWRSRPRRACAPGLVAGPTPGAFADRQLRLPRTLVQLDERTWLVADLADWTRPRGVVWKMTDRPGQPVQLQPLLTGLSLPHGLAIGPDGLAYVGEMSRIFRFDPRATDPAATVRDVVTGLPDNRLHDNRHPTVAVRVRRRRRPAGQCRRPVRPVPGRRRGPGRDRALRPVRGARRPPPGSAATPAWGRAAGTPGSRCWPRGLRNSVALAVHPSGAVLQAENSYDFDDRWNPFEEINLIEAGRRYGWPYCQDMATPTPGWAGTMDCALAGPHPARRPVAAPRRAPGHDLVPRRGVPQAGGQAADGLARLPLDRRPTGRLRGQ